MKKTSTLGDMLAEQSRWRNHNPIRNLTPQSMVSWLEQWRAGYLYPLACAWDEIIERDDVIPGVVSKRMDGVGSCDWEVITPDDDDDPEAEAHADALRELYNNITTTDAVDLDVMGGMELLISQIALANGYKYSVHEIVWQPGSVFTAELRHVPLRHFERTTGRLRYSPNGTRAVGVELADGEWLRAASHKPGLMVATGIAYLYKIMPLRDWLTYSECNGLLYVLFKTSATVNSQEWQDAEEAVSKIAGIFGAVVSEGTEMERMGAGQGELPYPALIERMDRAIASLWRGSDLSTLSADNKGASVQEDEARNVLEGDCAFAERVINQGLGRHYIRYRFGEGVRPKAYLKINPPTDIDEEREQKKFSQAMKDGVAVSLTQYQETIGLREPDGEQDTLRGKAQPDPDPDNPNRPPQPDEETAANERIGEAVEALLNAQGEDFAEFHRILDALERSGDSRAMMDLLTALDELIEQRSAELLAGGAMANELHRLGVDAFLAGARMQGRKKRAASPES